MADAATNATEVTDDNANARDNAIALPVHSYRSAKKL